MVIGEEIKGQQSSALRVRDLLLGGGCEGVSIDVGGFDCWGFFHVI